MAVLRLASSACPFIAGLGIAAGPALPPRGCAPCKVSDMVELTALDPTIRLDIRYATADNFVGRPVYPAARAFLQRPAAEALVSVHRRLVKRGYGLVIYDAYRPWSVTKLFWDVTPRRKRAFVARPSVGSVHNRGCAVDVGLINRRTGRPAKMPSEYDEMTSRSSVTYAGGTTAQRARRDLLRGAMEHGGAFRVHPREWWHYSFRGFRDYPIQDVPFSALAPARPPRRHGAPGRE